MSHAISAPVGRYKYRVGKGRLLHALYPTVFLVSLQLGWKGIVLSHLWWGLTGVPSSPVWSKTWIQTCWVCGVNAYLLCQDTSLQLWYLTRHEAILVIECEDSLAASLLFSSFTLSGCLILCSSLPEGGSSSGLKTASHTGGSGVEKRSYTHSSSYVTSSKEWRNCTVRKQRAKAAEMVWGEIQGREVGWLFVDLADVRIVLKNFLENIFPCMSISMALALWTVCPIFWIC